MELAAYVSWTLFKGGAFKHEEEAKRAALEESLARYEQMVLSVLKEVEGCLFEVSAWQKVLSSLEPSARTAALLKGICEFRFMAGLSDYLAVLDAEMDLDRLKLQELDAELGYLRALVKLYKALGGGWYDEN